MCVFYDLLCRYDNYRKILNTVPIFLDLTYEVQVFNLRNYTCLDTLSIIVSMCGVCIV